MNHDPMLRVAMKEVESILNKYDIGGFVSLESRSHSEFKLFIEPSWSLARFIKKDGEIKGVHFKIRAKTNLEDTNATAGLLMAVRDQCAMVFMQMDKLKKQLEDTVGLDHQPFGPNGISNDDR